MSFEATKTQRHADAGGGHVHVNARLNIGTRHRNASPGASRQAEKDQFPGVEDGIASAQVEELEPFFWLLGKKPGQGLVSPMASSLSRVSCGVGFVGHEIDE